MCIGYPLHTTLVLHHVKRTLHFHVPLDLHVEGDAGVDGVQGLLQGGVEGLAGGRALKAGAAGLNINSCVVTVL